MTYAKQHVSERAAQPKYIEIMEELPKTAVGKIFKPDLRKSAIMRVYNAALAEAGVAAHVERVVEDKKRGLVAHVARTGAADDGEVSKVLGVYAQPWEWAE